MKDDHDRFEVSFRNPIVRMWFYVMLPTIIVSGILYITLPTEQHEAVQVTSTIILIIFTMWTYFHKRKRKVNKGGGVE